MALKNGNGIHVNPRKMGRPADNMVAPVIKKAHTETAKSGSGFGVHGKGD